MTTEELKQEAEEWLCNNLHSASEEDFIKAMVDIAEPREKRIETLEKRCANYEMTISKMEKGTCDICKETEKDKKIEELEKACDETQELLDRQIEAAYRLDKENAELKHTIATLRQEKDNVSMHTKAMEVVAKTKSDQLTKAKEIIKNLLSAYTTYADSFDDRDNEIVEKAEQFISEVEK